MIKDSPLLDPTAGRAVLWIRCKDCGRRPVGVVQEGGRIPTAHEDTILTGYLRSTLAGKTRIRGERGLVTARGILDPAGTPRAVTCPRHGNLLLDQAAAHAAIVNNTRPRAASLHIGRDTPRV